MEVPFATERTNSTCFQKIKKNMLPLVLTMMAGLILLVTSGMHIGWSLYNINVEDHPWIEQSTDMELHLVYLFWFLGVIVGGFNAGYFIESSGRQSILYLSALSHLLGGLFFVIFPSDVISILLGRCFAGYGYGVVYLTMLAYTGEISRKQNRGTITSLIYLSTTIGILIFCIINTLTNGAYKYDMNRIFGCLTAILSGISFICIYYLTEESPLYLILNETLVKAVATLLKLRGETIESQSTETEEELEKMQILANEDKHDNKSIFKNQSIYFMFALKFLMVLTFNYSINTIRLFMAKEVIGPINEYSVQPIILIIVRLVSAVIPFVTMDLFGRKIYIIWTARGCSVCLILSAIVVGTTNWTPIVSVFLYEIFQGFGLQMAIDVLSTEIFTTKTKGTALGFVIFFESFLQLLILSITLLISVTETYTIIVFSVFGILIGLLSFLKIPETKNLFMKDARNVFYGVGVKLSLRNQ